jgi:hypothetical protein
MLEEIEYQLRSEKNNTSPFHMDNKALLASLSQNIKQNMQLYQKPLNNYSNTYIEQFNHYNGILEENYGHKII